MKLYNRNAWIVCALLTLLAVGPVVRAYPPDSNNAALLYYQAFISLPKGQDQEQDMVEDLQDGVDPNDWIREYLKQCQPAINLVVAASEVHACDWGLRYSKGFQMQMPHLAQMRALARLMKADAAVLVADKQYRQALERCLTIRRMAQHAGDENLISWLVSTAINALAEKTLQNTLNVMPPDPQTLVWLKGELTSVPGRQVQIKKALKPEEELVQAKLRGGKDQLIEAITESVDAVSPDLAEQIKKGDAAFFEGSGRYFKAHMDAVLAVFDSPASYVKRLDQLRDLEQRPGLDAKQNPHALLTTAFMPAVARLLTLDTRAKANASLLMTAIEIYLAKAGTGSIPDQLPPGVSKDPFNDQDFKYEKTQEGFTLTRWTDDPAKDKTYRFTFKVR